MTQNCDPYKVEYYIYVKIAQQAAELTIKFIDTDDRLAIAIIRARKIHGTIQEWIPGSVGAQKDYFDTGSLQELLSPILLRKRILQYCYNIKSQQDMPPEIIKLVSRFIDENAP